MHSFRFRLQHWFNPLHVYCRLRDCGVPRSAACRLTGFYERLYRLCRIRPSAGM